MAGSTEVTCQAPEELSVQNRSAFKEAAVRAVTQFAGKPGRLVLDLQATQYVDTPGLAVLSEIHQHANGEGVSVALKGANEEIRFSLALARLDGLFGLG